MLVGKRHYGCANVRNRGTCGNRLTIRRDVLEETVLFGLRDMRSLKAALNLLQSFILSVVRVFWTEGGLI